MSILTSIPSSSRVPGTSQEFDLTSAKRGLTPTTRRMVVVAARLYAPAWVTSTSYVVGDYVKNAGNIYRCTVAGTSGASAPTHTTGAASDGTDTWLYVQPVFSAAVATPTQIFTENDADALGGVGGEAALGLRAALLGARKYVEVYGGGAPEIYGVTLDDSSGTRSKWTLTASGTAAASGDVVFQIAGRTLRAGVALSDSANTIAASVKASIEAANAILPVTASVSSAVVTARGNTPSVNSNDTSITILSTPAGVTVTVAQTVVASGSYDLTTSLDTLVDKRYHAVAVGNHLANDVSDLISHADSVGAATIKMWTWGFLCDTGSVSTTDTLATGGNREQLCIIGYRNGLTLPVEVAAIAAASKMSEPDPSLSMDGVVLPIALPSSAPYIKSEQETLLANGVTPVVPTANGTGMQIVRMVTTRTTVNTAAFEDLLDISNIGVMWYMAEQSDIALKVAFPRSKAIERTRRQVRSIVIDVYRSAEALEIVQNVDAHLGEFQVEKDGTVKTRFNIATPTAVVPNLHQLAQVNRMIIE